VAAAKSQGYHQVVRDRVDVTSRREDHTLVRYNERPVQLGKLFERLAQVRVVYALALVGVAVQRIAPTPARSPPSRSSSMFQAW
jgi:hypothetical protein